MIHEATTRRAGCFADQQHGGSDMEERQDVQSHEQNYTNLNTTAQRAYRAERRRTEQQCRDYWVSVYGRQAERLSRGGTAWLL